MGACILSVAMMLAVLVLPGQAVGQETGENGPAVALASTPENASGFRFSATMPKSVYKIGENFGFDLVTDYAQEPLDIVVFIKITKEGYKYQGAEKALRIVKATQAAGGSFSWTKTFPEGNFILSQRGALTASENGFGGPGKFFSTAGKYDYVVKVFNCKDLAAQQYSCFLKDGYMSEVFYQNMGFFGDDRAALRLDSEISPLAELTFSVTVTDEKFVAPETPKECSSKKDCREGERCSGNQCFRDPYFCRTDADCFRCEGCQDSQAVCKDNKCVFCGLGRPCREGYLCEEWGCTGNDVLEGKPKCEPNQVCGFSKSQGQQFLCTISTEPLKSGKCLECWSTSFCGKGDYCSNYECLPLERAAR